MGPSPSINMATLFPDYVNRFVSFRNRLVNKPFVTQFQFVEINVSRRASEMIRLRVRLTGSTM